MKCKHKAYNPNDSELWLIGDSEELCCPHDHHHGHHDTMGPCQEECMPCSGSLTYEPCN